MNLTLSVVSLLAAAAISAVLLLWLRPWLARYALAKPNARSSHRIPTPQGGGIAVIVATLAAATAVIALGTTDMKVPFIVFGATLFIAIVGFVDDVKAMPVVPRLLLQGAAIAA